MPPDLRNTDPSFRYRVVIQRNEILSELETDTPALWVTLEEALRDKKIREEMLRKEGRDKQGWIVMITAPNKPHVRQV
jgi:hypothetical protein